MKTNVGQLLLRALETVEGNYCELARILGVSDGSIRQWAKGDRGKRMMPFVEKHLINDLTALIERRTGKTPPCPHHERHNPCHKLCEELEEKWEASDDGGRDLMRGMLHTLCPNTAPGVLKHLDHQCPSRSTKKKPRGNTYQDGSGHGQMAA